MLKKFFTYIFCILCVLCSSAQNHISTGTVIDSLNKEKLAFVNIIIRNDNNKGFISDMNGNFKVESN